MAAPEAEILPDPVLLTERLCLRRLREDDAPFLRELLMDPGWKRFIGDRGDCSLEQARDYILTGPIAMYAREGFGLWHLGPRQHSGPGIETPRTDSSYGLCGLIRREGLADVDIGFALLQRHTGQGYAYEAARAVLDLARQHLKLPRVVAITDPDNTVSGRLLEKLGLRPERTIRLKPDTPDLLLYRIDFKPGPDSERKSPCCN